MKSFKDYITESKKTFDFKIKVAGDLPEKFESTLKTALGKYGVATVNKTTTPIQKNPLDFPNIDNTEIHIFEVSLNYPVIPPVLRNYVMEKTGVENARIVVRGAREPEEEYMVFSEKDEKYVPKLTSTYESETAEMDKMAKELVGEKRVLNLFKELSAKRKEKGIDGTQSSLNIDVENLVKDGDTTSLLGHNILPDPKGMR